MVTTLERTEKQAGYTVKSKEKLDALLEVLKEHRLDGYYIPPDDEHLNEYLLAHRQRIQYLTGFHGENATVFVTPEQTTLFVDGRFHLQVDQEVDATVFSIAKMGLPQTPSFDELVKEAMVTRSSQSSSKTQVFRLGFDPNTLTPKRFDDLKTQCEKHSGIMPIKWVPVTPNLVDEIWQDRPAPPSFEVQHIANALAGQSVEEKIAAIRQELKDEGAYGLPITRLDEVAWVFNIRGNDIPYNPVVTAYGLITPQKAMIFVDADKLPAMVKGQLTRAKVDIHPYEEFLDVLELQVKKRQRYRRSVEGKSTNVQPLKIWLDEGGTTVQTESMLKPHVDFVRKTSPVYIAKAKKNDVEKDGMRWANLNASRVLIRHLAWVDEQVLMGAKLTEADLKQHLGATYRSSPGFYDFSFPSIIGLGSNSAIIHYGETDSSRHGQEGELYLLDSGAHFYGEQAGTTDTTRTTVLGEPDDRQISRYTSVLKAHIACSQAQFPKGTNGTQLDAICRQPLWQQQIDYRHGTGHGVGAFLNVHEGPISVSSKNTVSLEPGMIASIEPGYYEPNWGGIRIENLGLITEAKRRNTRQPGDETPWYTFEPLTWVPYERKLIDEEALTDSEQQWLKEYYSQLLTHFENDPTLTETELQWLRHQCDWGLLLI